MRDLIPAAGIARWCSAACPAFLSVGRVVGALLLLAARKVSLFICVPAALLCAVPCRATGCWQGPWLHMLFLRRTALTLLVLFMAEAEAVDLCGAD